MAEYPKFHALNELVARLRGENGCPWDRKQTPESIVLYLLEEAHELADAIAAGDKKAVCEELGDVLFQVLFIADIFADQGDFDVEAVAEQIHRKMVRRHPHVFGDVSADSPEEVRQRWHEIKMDEKKEEKSASILDSVPGSLPALMRAYRISERAARTGFDWDDIRGVMKKAEEEWGEFKDELKRNGEKPPDAPEDLENVSLEFGDLLFTLTNVARFARIHPETSLAGATRKFEKRFKTMEQIADDTGRRIDDVPRSEKEQLWNRIKIALAGD